MGVKDLTDEQRASIRQNTAYIEVLSVYTEACSHFDALPTGTERTNPPLYWSHDTAMHTAMQALDAIIDAHVAQQTAATLLAYRNTLLPITRLAELITDEEFHQSLYKYSDAWNAIGKATEQKLEQTQPERVQQLDTACEVAERGIVEAIQEFARRSSVPA